jgi:hypothetical protein
MTSARLFLGISGDVASGWQTDGDRTNGGVENARRKSV